MGQLLTGIAIWNSFLEKEMLSKVFELGGEGCFPSDLSSENYFGLSLRRLHLNEALVFYDFMHLSRDDHYK